MKKDLIQLAVGICSLIAIIMGGMAYFAKAADLRLVEMRLDQKVVYDQVFQVQQRLWQIEDRHDLKQCDKWPQSVKEEYRKLRTELDDLKLRQKNLMEKR